MFIFPVQLTTSKIGNLTRLIHTLAICDDHTYIHMEVWRYGGAYYRAGVELEEGVSDYVSKRDIYY